MRDANELLIAIKHLVLALDAMNEYDKELASRIRDIYYDARHLMEEWTYSRKPKEDENWDANGAWKEKLNDN